MESQKEWNYRALSANPNITWDIVLANPDKAWDYNCLSQNPNITWDIVSAHPDKAAMVVKMRYLVRRRRDPTDPNIPPPLLAHAATTPINGRA